MTLRMTSVAAAMAGLLTATPQVAAQPAAPFLPPDVAVARLVDGRAWSATTGDGKRMSVTFNRDGTSSLSGPMPLAIQATWVAKGEAICLSGPMGAKCLRFRQIAAGYEGWLGDKLEMTLARQ